MPQTVLFDYWQACALRSFI